MTMPSLGTVSECCSSLRDTSWLYLEERGALFPMSMGMTDLARATYSFVYSHRAWEKRGQAKAGHGGTDTISGPLGL